MIFFGWGKKSQLRDIDDAYSLLCVWHYFHLFWCPIAISKTWYIIGDSRSEDQEISYDDVKKIFPEDTPNISLWQRYGILTILIIVIFILALAEYG